MALTQSFDVEFNDSVLDLQGWKNPRHHGSKLIAKKINQLSPPEFSKGFSTSSLVYLGKKGVIGGKKDRTLSRFAHEGRKFDFGELNDPPNFIGKYSGSVDFNKKWGGDITYGLNPVIERTTCAIYFCTTLIDGDNEDPQYARIKRHSYVKIDKIVLVNPDTDEVTLIDSSTEDFKPFQRFITNDFPLGSKFNLKIIDKAIATSFDNFHHVKFNKGWLLKSFSMPEYFAFPHSTGNTVRDPLSLYVNGGQSGEIGGGGDGSLCFRFAAQTGSTTDARYSPSYCSASIHRNKFVDQYYSVTKPTEFFDNSSDNTNLSYISASYFISKSYAHIQNNKLDEDGDQNEIHITFFRGTYNFAPGANDQRSISTFELDPNLVTRHVIINNLITNPDYDLIMTPVLAFRHTSTSLETHPGTEGIHYPFGTTGTYVRSRTAPTTPFYKTDFEAHVETDPGGDGVTSRDSHNHVYVRGGGRSIQLGANDTAGTGSFSGSFAWEMSWLDKAPVLITSIDKAKELPNGVGDSGFVLIPEHADQVIKDNIEFYLQKAGIADVSSIVKNPRKPERPGNRKKRLFGGIGSGLDINTPLEEERRIRNGNLFGGLFQHGGDVDEDEPNDEGDGTGFLGGGNNPFF